MNVEAEQRTKKKEIVEEKQRRKINELEAERGTVDNVEPLTLLSGSGIRTCSIRHSGGG